MGYWVRFGAGGVVAAYSGAAFDGAELVEGVTSGQLDTCRRTDAGEWVPREPDPAVTYEPSAEDIAAAEADAKRAEDAARKLSGIEFEGVMCSATGQDQAGLMAVLNGIQLAKTMGMDYGTTGFVFENGSVLNLSAANAFAFAAVWVPFRKSFFPAK